MIIIFLLNIVRMNFYRIYRKSSEFKDEFGRRTDRISKRTQRFILLDPFKIENIIILDRFTAHFFTIPLLGVTFFGMLHVT